MLLRILRSSLPVVQSLRFLPRNVKLFSTTDSGPEDKGPAKKAKPSAASTPHCSMENEPTWNLGGSMKFVKVTEFKGETRIDIREYYVDSNTMETKPGKRGISLNCEQYQKLKTLIPEIDQKLLELDDDERGDDF